MFFFSFLIYIADDSPILSEKEIKTEDQPSDSNCIASTSKLEEKIDDIEQEIDTKEIKQDIYNELRMEELEQSELFVDKKQDD